jgi:hypothetical protein
MVHQLITYWYRKFESLKYEHSRDSIIFFHDQNTI